MPVSISSKVSVNKSNFHSVYMVKVQYIPALSPPAVKRTQKAQNLL